MNNQISDENDDKTINTSHYHINELNDKLNEPYVFLKKTFSLMHLDNSSLRNQIDGISMI